MLHSFARGSNDGGVSGFIRTCRSQAARVPHSRSAIVHYVDRDISEMLRRLDRYTSARAEDLRDSGDIGSYWQNLRRIASRFWKCYIGRKGYREGPWGFLIALCAALYPILSYLKARLEPLHPPAVQDGQHATRSQSSREG